MRKRKRLMQAFEMATNNVVSTEHVSVLIWQAMPPIWFLQTIFHLLVTEVIDLQNIRHLYSISPS